MGWDAVQMKLHVAILVFVSLMSGCSSVPKGPVSLAEIDVLVREDVTIIKPVSNDRVDWAELLLQIDGVDVVLLGELHDHAVGHAVQLALVEDVLDSYPNSVLAMEMLERDEQILIDDYMEDFIDASTFEKLTNSCSSFGCTILLPHF